MSRKLPFKPTIVSLAVSSILCSNLALAQEQEKEVEADNTEIIQVVGIRRSLAQAQAVKMGNDSIVEALSAEDIGKLPDSSIAESLARLPGLAGERRNGRTSGISVRGFREDFITTTLNGRELIGIGDNRGVEFDLYPSEIISGAVVYKTAEASLVSPGIGGTVDLQTVRPLDAPTIFTINGSLEENQIGEINPDFSDSGHRYAVTFSDSFADEKFGLALTYASLESPNQTQFVDLTPFGGYADGGVTEGPNAGVRGPSGLVVGNRSRLLERDTVSAVVQFAPNDAFITTVDYLNIDFSESGINRGLWNVLGNASDGSNIIETSNGVITRASALPFRTVYRSEPLNLQGDLETFGINLEYSPSDAITLKLDFANSTSSKSEQRAESYAGVGRAGLSTQGGFSDLTWTATDQGPFFDGDNIDYSDPDLIRLAGPQAWGGGLASIPELQEGAFVGEPGIGFSQAQDGFDNTAVIEEELDTFRLQADVDAEFSIFTSFQVGFNYREQTKSKENLGFFLVANTFPDDGPIPEELLRGTTDLAFAGLGQLLAYDAQAAIDSGFYTPIAAANLEPNRLGDTYSITETVFSPFIKLDFETEIGDVYVYGNVGAQYQKANQRNEAFSTQVNSEFTVDATPISGGFSYGTFLPSLNVNFDLGDDHLVRLSLGKAITRPRIDQLGAGSAIAFDTALSFVTATNPDDSAWSSNSGNILLEPYESEQLDLSYEWYYSDLGYLSATYFYKNLTNWNRSSQRVRDYSDAFVPGFHQGIDGNGDPVEPATFLGIDSFAEGGLTGDLQGIELQVNIQFGEFSDALDGAGLVLNGAFSDGELDDNSRIPGMSDTVLQATLFYQIGGFEARVSATDRDDFLSEQRGGSNSIDEVTRQGATLVDAQISYDFADSGIKGLDGLRISLQGQNLTDEVDTLVDEQSGAVILSETYGRNFLIAINYSFF